MIYDLSIFFQIQVILTQKYPKFAPIYLLAQK